MNVLPYYTDHQIIILGKIYYRFRSIRRFDSFFVKFSSQFGSFRASPRHMLPRRSGTLAAAGVPFRARSVLRLGNMSRRGSTHPEFVLPSKQVTNAIGDIPPLCVVDDYGSTQTPFAWNHNHQLLPFSHCRRCYPTILLAWARLILIGHSW